MAPPLRILRAEVHDHLGIHREFTPRQKKQQGEILGAAERLWVSHGFAEISLSMIAASLCITVGQIRYHYADKFVILDEILRRHLKTLADAVAQWPLDHPDWRRRRCEFYLQATHCRGGLALPHMLLLSDLDTLPEDLRPHTAMFYQTIITTLGGSHTAELAEILNSAFTTEEKLHQELDRLFPDEKECPAPSLDAEAASHAKAVEIARICRANTYLPAVGTTGLPNLYDRPRQGGKQAEGGGNWHDPPPKHL